MSSIAFIGTGIMGAAMAGHLLDAGHALFVYNRTKEKARGLLERGALWRSSPAACVRDADFAVTIVGCPKDVEEIYFGENGLLSAARPGMVLIDMTTSSPDLARRIYEAAAARGIAAVDAPVSGGDTGAKNASLAIMAGGDAAAVERAMPLFRCMGKTVSHLGPAGAGQHTKMANQIAVAGAIAGVAEAVAYSRAAGLAPPAVLSAIGSGAAASWQLQNNGSKMAEGDFAPGFYIKHFVKDMGIALEEAELRDLPLPVLRKVDAIYRELSEEGYDALGTQAILKYYEK